MTKHIKVLRDLSLRGIIFTKELLKITSVFNKGSGVWEGFVITRPAEEGSRPLYLQNNNLVSIKQVSGKKLGQPSRLSRQKVISQKWCLWTSGTRNQALLPCQDLWPCELYEVCHTRQVGALAAPIWSPKEHFSSFPVSKLECFRKRRTPLSTSGWLRRT